MSGMSWVPWALAEIRYRAVTIDCYSLALLGSFMAGGAAMLVAVVPRRRLPPLVRRAGWWLGAIALVLLAISAVVHARVGHGPQSETPLGFSDFIGAHPAFVVAALLAVVAIGLLWVRRCRPDRGGPGEGGA